MGNPTSATDPDGSTTLTYDNLNRVVGVSGPWGVTQAFGYDAADNRTSTSDNKGGSSASTFDNLNRLKSRTQTATGMGAVRADWAYTAAGDVGTVTRYSDAAGTVLAGTTTDSYDALGRLVGIDHKNAAGTSVGTYAYTFDAGDRLTGETFNGTGKTYAYDKLGQLTSDNGSAVTYDAAGNRSMGGYVTGTGNRTTADGTWTYTYDDAGQMTGKSKSGEAWAYTYDHRGQMTSASKSATPGGTVTDSVSYKTDAWGNRIGRDQLGTSSSTERYVVDGWDTAKPGAAGTENFEAVIDLDGSNAVTARRVFGAGFDAAVARQDAGGGVTWYGADGQGTVRQVFDNTGSVSGGRAFTGFGAVTATSGTGLDRYAYTGTVTDPLTGLVGDDARQYDPTLGKWTSDDPIGFSGGDFNVGRYVGNRTTTATDPSGLWGSYITDWLAKQTQGQHEAVHVPAVFVAGLVRNLDFDRHLGDAAAEAARGNTRPLEAMRNGADFYQMGDDYNAARGRGDNVAASASMALLRNNILSAPFLGFYEAAMGEHTGGVRHGQLLTEDEIAEKYTGGVIATFAAAYGGPKGTLGRTRGLKATTVTSPALPAAEVVTTQLETVVIDSKPTVVQVTRTGVGRGPSIVPPAATGGVADAALARPALPAPTPSGTCTAPAPVAHVARDGTRFATATERFLYEEATRTGKGSQVDVAPARVHPALRFGDEAAGYKLPKDIAAELNDAAKVKAYDDLARQQMKALGIPEEMHGNLPGTFGEGKGAFSPHGISGGGNTHYLTQPYVPRINVDAAVLDSAHPVFTQVSPSWKTASLEARMQAVAAHEYAEAMMHSRGIAGAYPKEVTDALTKLRSGGAGPYLQRQLQKTVTDYGHLGAVKNAPDLPGLSAEAKQILVEYRRTLGLE